ncbi:MAG: enoyl-CoA hydratase-related protein, partial [Actinomycetota bacterium]
MSYETLLVETAGAVTTVTLNRPAKRNAVNAVMFEELDAAFGAIASDPATRAFVLTGAGGHFCSGVDLTALDEIPRTKEEMAERMD